MFIHIPIHNFSQSMISIYFSFIILFMSYFLYIIYCFPICSNLKEKNNIIRNNFYIKVFRFNVKIKIKNFILSCLTIS